ncbi:hypothetical protein, partial [Streptomyces sp. NRRL F-3273]
TNTAGAVVLHLTGGTVQVGVREFYALLESDPELPLIGRHRPVVLLVPGLGSGELHDQQHFSLTNDRTVWSHDGAPAVPEDSATQPEAPSPDVWRRTVPQLPSAGPSAT